MVKTTYFVTDIETDGPYPGEHSMLASASIVCRAGEGIVGQFEINLETLPDADWHDHVLAWWKERPETCQYITDNARPPERAMDVWRDWVESFAGRRVFVAHPISFDGNWIDWYMLRYLDMPLVTGPLKGPKLFDGVGLDLPSFASALLDIIPGDAHSSNYTPEMMDNIKHSHKPIDDARGYANLLLHLLELRAGL